VDREEVAPAGDHQHELLDSRTGIGEVGKPGDAGPIQSGGNERRGPHDTGHREVDVRTGFDPDRNVGDADAQQLSPVGTEATSWRRVRCDVLARFSTPAWPQVIEELFEGFACLPRPRRRRGDDERDRE
jgi:hypothetical protein